MYICQAPFARKGPIRQSWQWRQLAGENQPMADWQSLEAGQYTASPQPTTDTSRQRVTSEAGRLLPQSTSTVTVTSD